MFDLPDDRRLAFRQCIMVRTQIPKLQHVNGQFPRRVGEILVKCRTLFSTETLGSAGFTHLMNLQCLPTALCREKFALGPVGRPLAA